MDSEAKRPFLFDWTYRPYADDTRLAIVLRGGEIADNNNVRDKLQALMNQHVSEDDQDHRELAHMWDFAHLAASLVAVTFRDEVAEQAAARLAHKEDESWQRVIEVGTSSPGVLKFLGLSGKDVVGAALFMCLEPNFWVIRDLFYHREWQEDGDITFALLGKIVTFVNNQYDSPDLLLLGKEVHKELYDHAGFFPCLR